MSRVSRTHLLLLALGACFALALGLFLGFAAGSLVSRPALQACAFTAILSFAVACCWSAVRASRRAVELQKALVATREAVSTAALRDPRTGLGNYRTFETILQTDFLRAQRYGDPFSVLLIEATAADYQRGGAMSTAQDNLMKFVATVLTRSLRDSDTVTRLSDAMFGVVLCRADQEGAQGVWERVRSAALAQWPEPRSWSLSGGTAAYSVDIGKVETLVATADRRLALEKRRLRAEPET
jgi:diguanylate cyclase (GGDEF)-like protein